MTFCKIRKNTCRSRLEALGRCIRHCATAHVPLPTRTLLARARREQLPLVVSMSNGDNDMDTPDCFDTTQPAGRCGNAPLYRILRSMYTYTALAPQQCMDICAAGSIA
jgi:hypothetical protein